MRYGFSEYEGRAGAPMVREEKLGNDTEFLVARALQNKPSDSLTELATGVWLAVLPADVYRLVDVRRDPRVWTCETRTDALRLASEISGWA